MDNKRTKLHQRRPQITCQESIHCAGEDKENIPLTKTKLPHDVLFKLPNQSLARIKCVSKEFKAAISHPDFIALRRPSLIIQLIPRRSITTSTLFFKHFRIGFPKVEEIPLEMANHMPKDPYLIGSCHGLLCFVSFKRTGKIHYVYNSLTKEWKSSPPIESYGKRFCGLYHKMSTNTYHLLTHVLSKNHLSNGIRIMDGQYKVHELGTSAWRAVSEENNPYVPLQCKQTPVAISSCLYWICFSNKEHESRMILAFDVEMEKFSYIKEPTGVDLPHNDSEALTLVETDFGLGYPTFTEATMNIWVMRGQDRGWEKFYAINLKPIQVFNTCWYFPRYVVLLCTMGEIWFSDHGSHTGGTIKLTIYDCNLHTLRSIDFQSLFPECFAGVINYTACLWKSSISSNAF